MPARAGEGGITWGALTPFRRIFDDFDRLFEDMQRSFLGGAMPGARRPIEAMLAPTSLGGEDVTAWAPRIEVRDTDKEYVIVAELPGAQPGDVRVEITDDGLVLQGEMRQEHTEDEGGVWRSERRYGSFYRLIPLPQDLVDTDRATAEFRNGLLMVRLPKTEAAQQRVRRIQIVGAEPIEGQAGAGAQATGAAGGQAATGGEAAGTAGGQPGGEGGRRRSA